MNPAARRATLSGSGSTSIFKAVSVGCARARAASRRADRVLPASRRRHVLRLFRTPAPGLVLEDGRACLEDRIDDAPRFLDVVLAREQGRVARHGITEHPFV